MLASVIAIAPPCFACTCAESTDEERFEDATSVFTGTVIDFEDAPPDPDGNDQVSWRIDVESVEKGGAAPIENVLTGTKGDTCSPGFEIEKRYQIFTSRNADGRLETNLCSGTHVLESKEPPVRVVEPPRPPEPDQAATAASGRDEGPNSIRKWAITVLVWAILAVPVVLLSGRRKPTSPGA